MVLRILMLWELTIVGNRDKLSPHKGKTAAGTRRGKRPHPSPCQPHAHHPQLPCGLATHLRGCWHPCPVPSGSQQVGQCRFPSPPLLSPAPGIMARLVPPCPGTGEARGAQASYVAFHQTWSLGAWVLLS